jgi:hypothetical protein
MSAQALLDTLLPGDGDFPAGGIVAAALAAHDRFGPVLTAVLALVPEDFAAMAPDARTAVVQDIETSAPQLFDGFVVGAYSLYYTHPSVAAVLARVTGYRAGPPQPGGHALAPSDPALLAVPAARGPLYRPTPEVAK